MWTHCNYCIVNYFIKWGSQISLYVLCKVGMNECYIISSLIEWCQHFFIHDWHYSCQSDNNVKLGYTMEAVAFIFACFHYYTFRTGYVVYLYLPCLQNVQCRSCCLIWIRLFIFFLFIQLQYFHFKRVCRAHASFANIVSWVMHFW